MSADTKLPGRAHGAHFLRIVIALVALSACAAFAIQAWFAYGFARYVWQLPQALSLAVPVANDLYIVTLMVVSYLLRNADSRVRMYVWCVLGLGIGAQIGAAWSFENWRSTGAHAGVSFAALIPAALLAAALHSLIIAARHMPADEPRRAPVSPAKPVEKADPSAAPKTVPGGGVKAPPTPPPPAAGRQTSKGEDPAVAQVRILIAGGMSCKDAAAKLGRSKRWAEVQTRDIRTSRDATQRDIPSPAIDLAAIAPGRTLPPKGIGAEPVALHPDVAGRDIPKVTPPRVPSVRL